MADGKLSVGLHKLLTSLRPRKLENNGPAFPSVPVQPSPSKNWPTRPEHPDIAHGQEETGWSAQAAVRRLNFAPHRSANCHKFEGEKNPKIAQRHAPRIRQQCARTQVTGARFSPVSSGAATNIRSQGNSEDFDELVRQFNFKGLSNDALPSGPQLRLWISALSHVVSRLERTHSALPEAIITMPWTTMDSQFVKSYTSFIGMLVSARPEYLSLVLEKIVQGLTYCACDHLRSYLDPRLTF